MLRVSVKFITAGSADTPIKIVFLHGGPGMDHNYFLPYFEGLERNFGCVYYTQGQGQKQNLSALLAEIESVRKAVCRHREKFVLLGHSFGGTLALEYIRKFGEKNLLALVAISWNYNIRLQMKFMRAGLSSNRILQHELPLDYSDREYRQDTIQAASLYFTEKKRAEGIVLLKSSRFDFNLAQKLRLEFLNRYNGQDILKSLNLPVLCLYGSRDRIVTPRFIEHGLGLNPRIIGKKISGAGHFPFVEKTKDVCGHVKGFLFSLT